MVNDFQKFVILRTIDEKWQDHLYAMDQLREGIGLRAYGQKNPLIEYKQEGFAMFENMMIETNKETLKRIFRTDLSSVGKNTMNITPRAKNLKNKSNASLLPKITKASAQQVSAQQVSASSSSSFLNPNPNSLTKRQPIKSDKKVGRNEPCPCDSGKKYEKCHGE